MALTLANSKTYTGSTLVASFTTSFTVPAGDNRMLLVKVVFTNVLRAVSTITYAGQSLTKTDGAAADMTVENTTGRVEIWKLVAPPVGTADVVITVDGAVRLGAVIETWTDVHQTIPLGTFASATGTSTPPSVAVTSATSEIVTDCVSTYSTSTSHSLSVGSSQTSIGNTTYYATGVSSFRIGASYEAGASSVTMSWDTSSVVWAIGGVPIKPVTAGGGGGTTPPTPPAGATLGIGLAEVGIVPKRASPDFSPVVAGSSTYNVLENQQGDWEASGMFPKVLQGTLVGDQIIWDDIYTIPSVAPAGAICISALPTQNSPTQSLLVATQNLLVQYPLPVSGSPTTTAYPQLPIAVTSTTQAQNPESLLPIFYPSAFDAGGRVLELVAVQCVGQNFTDEVDAWAISVRPDDTEPWSTTVRQKSAEALFWMTSGNYGRVWRLAAQILDGDQDDPIGPSGSQIIGWFREVKVDPATYSQRARAIPEVS